MPRLSVACALPEGLYLPRGVYGEGAGSIRVDAFKVEEGSVQASMTIEGPISPTNVEKEAFQAKEALKFIKRLNFLLRWHRAVTQSPSVREMTLAQASPFVFYLEGSEEEWGVYSESPFAVSSDDALSPKEVSERVQEGFSSEKEPPVEELLLLDARQALEGGRFREAVLMSWSVIDSTFNHHFDRLVNKALAGEWRDAVDFLKGNGFGLRNKMTIGLRLAAKRSLHQEPDDFWNQLSASYKVRNAIIHDSELASEEQAKAAVVVAQRIVSIMPTL